MLRVGELMRHKLSEMLIRGEIQPNASVNENVEHLLHALLEPFLRRLCRHGACARVHLSPISGSQLAVTPNQGGDSLVAVSRLRVVERQHGVILRSAAIPVTFHPQSSERRSRYSWVQERIIEL